MKLTFSFEKTGYELPLNALGKRYGFSVNKEGRKIVYKTTEKKILTVSADNNTVSITAPFKAAFFRGLLLAVEKEQKGELSFHCEEEVLFDFNGLMIDCSRNGVINIAYGKALIEMLAAMGHTVFMLYMEDVYELEGEKYFGYLRGKYTKGELQELDDYAHSFGIELIPCIQTLAHLDQFLIWDEPAAAYLDIENILNVGDEKVKKLIERMIGQLSKTFRSRRIHVGMDEAYYLGRGKYAEKHGFRSTNDIMTEHLNWILKICEKNKVRPIIWDDMFFSSHVPSLKEGFKIPQGVDLMYWDYYNNTPEHYRANLKKRIKSSDHTMFAGGAWKWTGYAPHHEKTIVSTNAAMQALKELGIREVLVTSWADDSCESPVNACLLGTVLFAEHGYNKTVGDEWKKRLKFLTGMSFEEFYRQQEIDIYPEIQDKSATVNPGKYFFYEDPLCSIFVYHAERISGDISAVYEDLSRFFKLSANRHTNPILTATQRFYQHYCAFMTTKWNLGKDIYHAYKKNDKNALNEIAAKRIPRACALLEKVRQARKTEWYLTNKSFGFEVLDLRMGGVKQRLLTAAEVIKDYLDGRLLVIEELEEIRQNVTPWREKGAGEIIHFNRCQRGMTASKMVW